MALADGSKHVSKRPKLERTSPYIPASTSSPHQYRRMFFLLQCNFRNKSDNLTLSRFRTYTHLTLLQLSNGFLPSRDRDVRILRAEQVFDPVFLVTTSDYTGTDNTYHRYQKLDH